jgi:hypothetical protein
MIYANGDTYEGHFSNGHRHGGGVFRNLQQTIKYDGEWQLGVRHGQGVLEDEHGLYRGGFADDLPHGQGVWKRKSGETYEGTFVRGQSHGTMIYTSADGRVVKVCTVSGVLSASFLCVCVCVCVYWFVFSMCTSVVCVWCAACFCGCVCISRCSSLYVVVFAVLLFASLSAMLSLCDASACC